MTDQDYLQAHRRVWAQKPVLRRIYGEQFYARLLAHCSPGARTLEIGSGPGLISQFDPSVIRTDILYSPWVNVVNDVHHLPWAANSVDNVIGLDVLHHFAQPLDALKEIVRVLRPQGRLILVEPWITLFSRLIYTYIHQESCDMTAQPWLDIPPGPQKQAFDGNAAIPYLLITKGHAANNATIPQLMLDCVEPFSSLTYLLSFGFKPISLLPLAIYPALYRLEELTRPLWTHVAALRVLLVWTKA